MDLIHNFTQTVLVLISMIFLGVYLRKRSVFREEDASLFSRLITDVTLPALIFSSLAVHKIEPGQIEQPLLMMSAGIVCILFAWKIADILKLDRPRKGAFILVSVFGSSAFLGYPVIKGVFPGVEEAVADAVIVSELGVGLLIFTAGVYISMLFGRENIDLSESFKIFRGFIKSPVFIALLSGLSVSFLSPNKDNFFFSTLLVFTHTVSAANTLFVTLTIGIMLKFGDIKPLMVSAVFVCILKLILKPILVSLPAGMLGFPDMWRQVMVIEASMPSATLAVIFARRYGCDSVMASRLLIITLVCSIFTMALMVSILL